MKCIYAGFALLLLGITSVNAICIPNTICPEERDTIIQVHEAVEPEEMRGGRGRRAWYIQPQRGEFNTILAFKNFSSANTPVLVIAYSRDSQRQTQYFSGDQGNFEVVLKDVIGVMIFVPLNANQTINFVLNYYTGCDILTSSQDQITYFKSDITQPPKKCWLIYPSDNNEKRRIYFSLRDVTLGENQSLVVWDVHTTQKITTAKNGEESKLAAAQTGDYPLVLIDLVCSNNSCKRDNPSFFVSYYAMNEQDVNCITAHGECLETPNKVGLNCNLSCPAFENMVMEEIGIQSEPSEPTIRSQTDYFAYMAWRMLQCLRRPKLCPCPKKIPRHFFCNRRIQCIKLKNCVHACIYYKMTSCTGLVFLDQTLI